MPLGQHAESLEDLPHALGHLGLARAGIAGDQQMYVRLLDLAAAHRLDAGQLYLVGERAHLVFHPLHADEVVETLQDVVGRAHRLVALYVH